MPSSGGNGGNGAKSLKMSEFYKKRANTVRADTLYSLMTIERDSKDDDRIKITYLCSIDFQSSIPMAIIDPFVFSVDAYYRLISSIFLI